MITQKIPAQNNLAHDELILVVKRHDLLGSQAWHGINHVDIEQYTQLIAQKKEFLPRSLMELDPTYKQIIPYIIFQHEDRYFLMQRQAKASETRLQNKYTLGIGGHIRQEDMSSGSLLAWAQREFHEEVFYHGTVTQQAIGMLNDDTNEVGKVHTGFLILMKGDNPNIRVKSELKSGQLVTLQECALYYDKLESWSQMVFDYLKTRNS